MGRWPTKNGFNLIDLSLPARKSWRIILLPGFAASVAKDNQTKICNCEASVSVQKTGRSPELHQRPEMHVGIGLTRWGDFLQEGISLIWLRTIMASLYS
jgi:hypothetical protein